MYLNGTSEAAASALVSHSRVGRTIEERSFNDFFFGVFVREATLQVGKLQLHLLIAIEILSRGKAGHQLSFCLV